MGLFFLGLTRTAIMVREFTSLLVGFLLTIKNIVSGGKWVAYTGNFFYNYIV